MKLVVFSLLLLAVFGFRTIDHHIHNNFNAEPIKDQQELWFEHQILDHFDPMPPATYWRQRYFVLDEYYDKATGPLFLYICGEGECRGIPKGRGYTSKLAEKYSGIAIALEHRFYGQSQPFGHNNNTYSTENLAYLTHDQGLADLAVFIQYLKDSGVNGISQDTPVITIGGSYPGAMSAWFRYKYRHLTLGSLASSAVVHAIEDFQDYDKQIGISTSYFGDYCPNDIKKLNKYVARQLASPSTNQALKQQFNATMLSDDEFLEMFCDIFSGLVQYGQTETLCVKLLKGKSIQQQLQGLAKHASEPESYTIQYQQDTVYDHGKNARQWTYQVCTAFGWFQTAYQKDPLRDSRVNLQYFLDKCEAVYGKNYTPNVPLTNILMGATKMRVNNIIFTNGAEDPWQWASIEKDLGQMKAYVAECVGCGHCADLGTPKPSDPVELKYVRTQIEKNFDQWLAQYRKQVYGAKYLTMNFANKDWTYDEDVQEYINSNQDNFVQEKLRKRTKIIE